jgi:EAL domain-containing protein (putative c-di-GMP-specific phosphodiesterase class I)/GGDEF domain-containing protein
MAKKAKEAKKAHESNGADGKRFIKHVGRISIIIALLFLTCYLITIISASSSFYADSAEKNAKIYFDKDMKVTSELVKVHYDRLYAIVDRVEYSQTKEDVDEIISSYIGSEEFGDLRYYSNGVAYSPSGEVVDREISAHEMILALSQSNMAGCTAVYNDERVQVDCIAFFVPVRGSEYIDGLLSIVPADDIISVGDVLQENTSMVAVVSSKGKMFSCISAESFTTNIGSNIYDFLEDLTINDKGMVDKVRALLIGDDIETAEIQAAGVRYTVVAEPIEAFDDHLHLVTISKSQDLINTELNFIRHIVNILLIAIVAFLVGLVYAFLFQRKAKEALNTANLKDATLECANSEGFRRNAMNRMHASGRSYAVVVMCLRRFHFVEDRFGTEASIELLKFITQVLASFCNKNETYGYAGDGKFLLLVEFSSESAFRNKLMLFENIVNKYDALVENQVKVKIAAGLCLASGKRRTVTEMIDCATIVCEEAKNDISTPCMVFTENVREKINHNEQIEARMDTALENNEFRLFLQPKYNIEKDEIDSAEALVRWFDNRRGDYIYPAEFISLFETNGFIVKMDYYIYIEVLKYISEALEKGEKIVPISVNVSRVTASAPDFINFYVGNKKKYRIDDNLITLEFTETFAVEDYAKFAEIVQNLHKGGIRCSIDDFGVGYSTFRVLKELDMDEIKLDKVFLEIGADAGRDDIIIKTLVDLAHNLGMAVVQEGVESKAMLNRVAGMGIGIIQGYYYAKAIPLEEFKIFINSNTSIRYKSIVK